MKIVRKWFRCTECSYRVSASGPDTTDWEKVKPCVCGSCRALRDFVLEKEAA